MIGGEIWASVRGETTSEGGDRRLGNGICGWFPQLIGFSLVNGDFDFCDFAVLTVLVVYPPVCLKRRLRD